MTAAVEAPSGEAGVASARLVRLAEVTVRLAELCDEISDLSRTRRDLVAELHADSYSHARIAAAAGLSRGRIFQILREVCRDP